MVVLRAGPAVTRAWPQLWGSRRAEGQRPCPAGRQTDVAFQNKNHKQTAQVQNRKEFLAGPRKPDLLIRPEVTHLAA